VGTDEGAGFGDILEETDGHYVAWVGGSGGDHGEGSPKDHHGRKEDAGFQMVQGKVAGYLADDTALMVLDNWQWD